MFSPGKLPIFPGFSWFFRQNVPLPPPKATSLLPESAERRKRVKEKRHTQAFGCFGPPKITIRSAGWSSVILPSTRSVPKDALRRNRTSQRSRPALFPSTPEPPGITLSQNLRVYLCGLFFFVPTGTRRVLRTGWTRPSKWLSGRVPCLKIHPFRQLSTRFLEGRAVLPPVKQKIRKDFEMKRKYCYLCAAPKGCLSFVLPPVAQLARASDCGSGGQWFEPTRGDPNSNQKHCRPAMLFFVGAPRIADQGKFPIFRASPYLRGQARSAGSRRRVPKHRPEQTIKQQAPR